MTANPVATRLNDLPAREARAELEQCCAARAWAQAMTEARPFPDDEAVFRAAERLWWDLEPEDWHEAFRAHPRIGEQRTRAGKPASAWSRDEQRGMDDAADAVRAALHDANERYEHRFGHVFLICASGLTATAMLEAVTERLEHDPETELRIAAEEQSKITRVRLGKLVA